MPPKVLKGKSAVNILIGRGVTVKIIKTKRVIRKFGGENPCILVVFSLADDKNFMKKSENVYDWMPTADELSQLVLLFKELM